MNHESERSEPAIVATPAGEWDLARLRRASRPIRHYQGPIYEQALDRDPGWAMSEGSLFFEGKGAVQEALRKIARRLDALGIPYAVAGGLALFRHGYRRFTEDIDILVTRADLKRIHEHLDGLGYLPPFTASKNLRDTDLGVRIEFLVTGDYPGDGRVKPVAFPDPREAGVEIEGTRVLSLERLIELKIASGMTARHRKKDLVDVTELIKILNLPRDYSDKLDPFVRESFQELWEDARRRFLRLWPVQNLAPETATIDHLITSSPADAGELEQMKTDGVFLDPENKTSGGYFRLLTTDANVARKYGFEDESEFWVEEATGPDQPS